MAHNNTNVTVNQLIPIVANAYNLDFNVKHKINSGVSATVFHATIHGQPECRFAVRIQVVNEARDRPQVEREKLVCAKLIKEKHVRGIVDTFVFAEHRFQGQAYTVAIMQCGEGTLMPNFGGALTTFEIDVLFRGLINGLRYLHLLGIVHTDLHWNNLLIGKRKAQTMKRFQKQYPHLQATPDDDRFFVNDVMICDFGWSHLREINDDSKVIVPSHNRFFASPEQLAGIPVQPRQVDFWALGVHLYGWLKRSFPFGYHNLAKFRNATAQEMLTAIQNNPPTFTPGEIAEYGQYCHICTKLLSFDINDRYKRIDDIPFPKEPKCCRALDLAKHWGRRKFRVGRSQNYFKWKQQQFELAQQ